MKFESDPFKKSYFNLILSNIFVIWFLKIKIKGYFFLSIYKCKQKLRTKNQKHKILWEIRDIKIPLQ